MGKPFDELNEKIKALRGISSIQKTWSNVSPFINEAERSRYLLMLESAKFFMVRNDFGRVNREYRLIHQFLRTIQSRGKDI